MRTIRIAIAAALLCGGALGAGAAGQTGTAAGELPLVEFVNDFAYDGVAETRLAELWGELTGTNFVPINIPRSDYDAKMATFMASGDMPEIARVLDQALTNAVDQFKGALFVDTLAEIEAGNMPGLGALVDEIPGILQYSDDGRVYTQPFVNMGLRAPNSNILLRTDLLATAGYDVETLDDVARTPGGLFELFRASHLAMNGGSEPILTNRRGIGPRGWIVSPIALQFGTYNRIYFNEDNRYEYGPTMDRFLVAIDFIGHCTPRASCSRPGRPCARRIRSASGWRRSAPAPSSAACTEAGSAGTTTGSAPRTRTPATSTRCRR